MLFLQKLGDEASTEQQTGKHSVVMGTVGIEDEFLMVDQEKPMAVSLHNRLYRVKKNVQGQRLSAKMWSGVFDNSSTSTWTCIGALGNLVWHRTVIVV